MTQAEPSLASRFSLRRLLLAPVAVFALLMLLRPNDLASFGIAMVPLPAVVALVLCGRLSAIRFRWIAVGLFCGLVVGESLAVRITNSNYGHGFYETSIYCRHLGPALGILAVGTVVLLADCFFSVIDKQLRHASPMLKQYRMAVVYFVVVVAALFTYATTPLLMARE